MSLNHLKGNIFELQPLEIRRLLTTASVDGAGILQVLGTGSAENITINKTSGGKLTVSGVDTQFTPGTSAGQVKGIFVQAGGGSDTVLLTNNVRFSNNAGIPTTLAGNAGNDTITSGPGNDVLSGNDGDDVMDGGVGNDTMTGGANIDTSNYSSRSTAIRVSINNNADADGELSISENDKVETEEVLGGAGNDTIIGSNLQDFMSGGAGADSITGNGGNDELIGSSGTDKLFGNDGDDYLHAQNNDADTVNGGTNSDGSADFDAASIDGGIDTGGRGTFAPAASLPGSTLDTPYGGATDTSVEDDGKAKAPVPSGWSSVAASAVDGQGNVLFVGSRFNFDGSGTGYGWDMVVAKLNANGEFDTTFNGNTGEKIIDFTLLDGVGSGYGNADDFGEGITIQPNGRIVVVGSHRSVVTGEQVFAVARLDATGVFDGSFNGSGMQTVNIQGSQGTGYGDVAVDAALDSGNKITVVGDYDDGFGGDFAVARLNFNGSIDTTFNGVGYTTIDINDGSSDSAKAVGLQVIASDANSPYAIVGGVSDDRFAVARIRENGTVANVVDVSLETDDAVLRDLAVAPNGNIVAVGNVSNFGISFKGAAPQPVEEGEQAGVVVILSPDLDSVLNSTEAEPGPDESFLSYDAVNVDSAGRIVVAGETNLNFIVGRYLPTLVFDVAFDPGLVQVDFTDPQNTGNEEDFPMAVRTLDDGKIIASGLNLPDSESNGNFVAVRFVGTQDTPPLPPVPPGNDEAGVTEVEGVVSYDQLHGNPPPPPLDDHFLHMSDTAKRYTLAQPDDNGQAIIELDDKDNNVFISLVKVGKGDDKKHDKDIAVNVDGVVYYYDPETTTRIVIRGHGGNDVFDRKDDIKVAMVIDGGEGNDVIKTDHGNDMLLGGPGNDTLESKEGQDILIGGTGVDKLLGSGGEDLLIGGTTSYDSDLDSLLAIHDEWMTKQKFEIRVDHLRNGTGLNGSVVLKTGVGATVFDDAAIDTINPGGSKDWVFARTTGANADILQGGKADTLIELV